MKTFFLKPGLLIEHLKAHYVLTIVESENLEFEQIETREKLKLTQSQFFCELRNKSIVIGAGLSSPKQIITSQSDAVEDSFISLQDIAKKYQEDVHRKVKYVTECIKAGLTRGQGRHIKHERHRIAMLINDPLGAPGVSTIQGWWKQWQQSQKDITSLISGHAVKRRNRAIDPDSEDFIAEQIDMKYANLTRAKIKTAYKGYCDALVIENHGREKEGKSPLYKIAYRTFYNRIKAMPEEELLIAREGVQAARVKMRQIKGHLPAQYPLDVVEIDHSPMNLYVIDDKAYLPLGRPWLTAIKDRYSGVLLGFSISFQKSGLESIFNCLQHSLEPHTKAYELWPDLINPWPCFGLGNYYASDRGRDFLSPKYTNAILNLGANYEHCAKRTPWLKGGIERFFNTLETSFFDAMPGKTFASLAKRGDYKPNRHAVIRFSTLVYLIYKWAVDVHNVTENSRKRARPLDLWNEGVDIVPPPLICSLDKLDIILGDENEGTLSHEGLRFKRLTYADSQLHALMKEVGPSTRLKFYVSRRDLRSISVLNPLTKQYMVIPCTRQDYANGLTLFQHEYIQHEAGKISLQKDAVDVYLRARSNITHRLEEALSANRSVNYSKQAHLANINSNDVIKGSPNSIAQPFKKPELKEAKKSSNIIEMPAYTRKKLKWG
jgi:putative transposase